MKVSRLFVLFILMIFAGWPAAAEQVFRPGEVIVKLRVATMSAGATQFRQRAQTLHGMRLKASWSELNLHHYALRPGDDVRQKIQDLSQDPAVEYAEPNYIIKMSGSASATYKTQSAGTVQASSTSAPYGLNTADIHVAETWPILTNNGSTVIVGVVDTGLDMTHPVFVNSGAVWTNTGEIANNGIDDDHNGYIDDVHGWNWVSGNNNPTDDNSHGTHVSGIVLGTSQNIFAASLQPAKLLIMPLKFLDSTGSGAVSDAVQAIYYGVNNGAKVLNNSWGGPSYSYSLLDAISYAYSRDVVFVVAAGNDSDDIDSVPEYPASYNVPSLIAVAATMSNDVLAGFSNYGYNSVPLAAPGYNVYSTLPNATFGYLSGTSMATPFVSGMAALMAREQPGMTGYQIKSLLMSSATTIGDLNGIVTTGARVDELAAVSTAQGATIQSTQPEYVAAQGTDGTRSPSSTSSGCGLITLAGHSHDDDHNLPGPGVLQILIFCAVLALPLLAHLLMRSRMAIVQRRKHDRFKVDSQVRMRVGDQELVGSVSTISLGGAQINTEAMLREGGLVMLSIQGPDGQQIQVDGRVVWSEADKRCGVQFANAQESALNAIRKWTRGLIPDNTWSRS